jgi:hypothetical protein
MQRFLYYPMVNPPGPIVWQGLLYWDGIASIVPWDRDYFQPLLRELHDTPFYKALDADNLKLRGGPRYDAMLREPEAIVEEVPGRISSLDPDRYVRATLIRRDVRRAWGSEDPDQVELRELLCLNARNKVL